MTKEKWIAFPEVISATDGLMRVGWTGMPAGFDNESLQLNVTALQRGVIGWGGYAALSLAAYDGDKDQYGYGVGLDSGGNAYATGTVVAQKAETSQFQTADDQRLNGRNIRSGHLGISWNMTTLNQRLETAQQFDPKVRARQLSREISVQASKAVWKHNVTKCIKDKSGTDLLLDAVIELPLKRFILLDPIIKAQEMGASLYAGAIVGLGVTAVMLPEKRISINDCINDPFFVVARPTRAAIASSILTSSKLVRPTPLRKLQ